MWFLYVFGIDKFKNCHRRCEKYFARTKKSLLVRARVIGQRLVVVQVQFEIANFHLKQIVTECHVLD
jgi:hypothetical protein